jgi:exodeoxyribonuclease V gamma subunit
MLIEDAPSNSLSCMTTSSPTGFMVLHSNQLEGLRDVMVTFMRKHPLPPLSPEVVLVQSNGMKHWLELALAKALGICAATQIELPSTQLWQIYRTVLGADAVPEHMPLDKSPLVWRIMRRLPAMLKQQGFEPLARYLNNDEQDAGNGQQHRMYQLAMQLADVLDGYQNYRADWLEDWAQGRDVLRPYADATQHVPLPEQHAWQAALWRDVLADLKHDLATQTQRAHGSRAQVHAAFLQALQNVPTGTRIQGLPERLMVFGVTSLPMQTVQALAALGRVCQVLMLVQNPCQYHWGHVVESRQPLRALQKQRQRNKPGLPMPNAAGHFDALTQYELHTQSNPLLAAWGKHGRDYLHLLDGFDAVEQYQHFFSRIDVFADPVETAIAQQRPATQLERLQSDILNLSPAPAEPEKRLDTDDSIEMLQTHGAQREVEVLHDKLLAWFDDNPKLKPSDIMVMVPDMAAFAPHIHAVFSRYASTDVRHIPYSVADTTPHTEPLVQALDKLMQLPQLRITQLEWQSWFEVDAVRERFGLDAQDVAQLNTWLQDSGVRWGLDAKHRAPWGIHTDTLHGEQNSWLFGIQRLLLGYATGVLQDNATPWRNTLPLQGVGGLDAHVMDGLLEWLRHIEWALLQLRQDHTPAEWVDVCRQLIDKFFKASNDADERLLERAMAPLETWLNECTLARFDEPVALQVLREHWTNQLQQPAMHQRFFGGGVQFATLMPMRSIPFEVVCLLGMNDADYPRRQTPRDFDLMRHTTTDDKAGVLWRAGDRSRREDDRYLFLEALLSARSKLYISWQGRRATDHEVMPPSVLVSQLMDHLNACWSPACDAPLQPLQAFSSQYFAAGSKFSTYASDWQPKALANADSDEGVNGTHNKKWVGSTPTTGHAHSDAPSDLTVQNLRRLLRQPVDVFFYDRLRSRLDTPNPDMAQEEPFALDKLQIYKLVSQMAFAQLKGACSTEVLTPLRLQGHLALAGVGEVQEKLLQTQCQTLTERLSPLLADWPHDLPVQSANFTLGQTVLQAQWAEGDAVWKQNADRTLCLQIDVRAGSVVEGKSKHRVPRVHTLTDVWVSHLLACASGLHTTSIQVGLNGAVQLDAIDAATALAHLQALVDAYQAAWRQPLPVARQAACAYLMAKQHPELNPSEAAEQVFVGNARQPGEQARSEHLKRAFEGFEAIAGELPAWAQRLYGPMVAAAHLWVNGDDAEGEAA